MRRSRGSACSWQRSWRPSLASRPGEGVDRVGPDDGLAELLGQRHGLRDGGVGGREATAPRLGEPLELEQLREPGEVTGRPSALDRTRHLLERPRVVVEPERGDDPGVLRGRTPDSPSGARRAVHGVSARPLRRGRAARARSPRRGPPASAPVGSDRSASPRIRSTIEVATRATGEARVKRIGKRGHRLGRGPGLEQRRAVEEQGGRLDGRPGHPGDPTARDEQRTPHGDAGGRARARARRATSPGRADRRDTQAAPPRPARERARTHRRGGRLPWSGGRRR